eukprot:CAMPEP_0113512950 /NCGR_PEP_ID=MMETSP0014_2-20120614/39601_1 /TAXON_ID=2857 /ORGANISM="Nitzschia sp." /LENGTH=776 /DNA_ID=CAMNT_0000409319 /DNA_START=26 /DNA_END=2352 /DNA_ORIENTATION=- /assembly_acc=CAM_ASM_000159
MPPKSSSSSSSETRKQQQQHTPPHRHRLHLATVCGIGLIILSLISYLRVDQSIVHLLRGGGGGTTTGASAKSGGGGGGGIVKSIVFGGRCKKVCSSDDDNDGKNDSPSGGGGDLLDRNDLLRMVVESKERLLHKLKVDYGEDNFDKIFVARPEDELKAMNLPSTNSTINRFMYRPFRPMSMHGKVHGNPPGDGNEHSVRRLHRKLMIKILTAQLEYQRQQSNVEGCNCLAIRRQQKQKTRPKQKTQPEKQNERRRRNLEEEQSSESSPPAGEEEGVTNDNENDTFQTTTTFSKMVWATGGHSAAAGHGNLFNESYTAFMERDVKDVFASIGIEFEARNYAMGGTGSSPELALCFDQIFGPDVDMFSWDYGMLEAGTTLRLLHYGYRGGLSRGRPAMVGIQIDGDRGVREQLLGVLENAGMSVFYQNTDDWDAMKEAIPETQGLNAEQLRSLPEYVRNFKCAGAIEKGEPFCNDEKYTDLCPDRFGKASWHPGFKWHALVGHSVSLFLVEALLGAVQALIDNPIRDIEILLSQLQSEEDETYHQIQNGDLSDYPSRVYKAKDVNGTDMEEYKDFDFSFLYRGDPFCHTARLPAQTRFHGYLTETSKTGVQTHVWKETYETGIEVSDAINKASNGTILLAYNKAKRTQRECPVIVAPDYKDFFFVHTSHGPSQISIPNEVERSVYQYDPTKIKGAVIFLLETCDWGKCDPGFLKREEFLEKKWSISINGAGVIDLINIGYDALLARPQNGRYFPPQGEDGIYTISIQVHEPDSFVRIS